MEPINHRVALIIEKLGMTKTAIAKRLKVSQQYISKLTTTGTPSERLIDDICREFNINEDWLRTGAGGNENMFMPDDMQYFHNVGKLGNEKNEFKKFYLNMMMGLPDEYWDYIYKEFKKFEDKKEE